MVALGSPKSWERFLRKGDKSMIATTNTNLAEPQRVCKAYLGVVVNACNARTLEVEIRGSEFKSSWMRSRLTLAI